MQGSKAKSMEEGEVAALLVLAHMVKVGVANTYWSGKVTSESLTVMLEHVRESVDDLTNQGARAVFLVGDLNVDMVEHSTNAERLSLGMQDKLDVRRLDMEGSIVAVLITYSQHLVHLP